MAVSSPTTAPLGLALGSARASSSDTDVERDVLALFDACAPALRGYVRSSGLAPDEAEDIVQDAFVALFRHLRAGGATHNLRGWLVLVSYRLALKHRQRSARRHRVESPWAEPFSELVVDPTESAERRLMAEEHRRRVRSVVEAMAEKDRQCLLLRAEGLPYRDIAHTLGISLGGVAKSLAQSIARLSRAGAR